MTSSIESRLPAAFSGGTVTFEIPGEGVILVAESGIRSLPGKEFAAEESDCTIIADAETFTAIYRGSLDPTTAFLNGSIKVNGEVAIAMKLANALR